MKLCKNNFYRHKISYKIQTSGSCIFVRVNFVTSLTCRPYVRTVYRRRYIVVGSRSSAVDSVFVAQLCRAGTQLWPADARRSKDIRRPLACCRCRLVSTVLFSSLAVLDPRVGHTMGVLSPFIPVLCHFDWLFHGESCPRLDVAIQAVHGLPPLCVPGIVLCIISFSRQLPCFLIVWLYSML